MLLVTQNKTKKLLQDIHFYVNIFNQLRNIYGQLTASMQKKENNKINNK